jgi:hypothetical protein
VRLGCQAEPRPPLLVCGDSRASDDLHAAAPTDTMRRMIEMSAEGSSLIAQVVAVIVFASVVELRKAFLAQHLWEMRILTGFLLVSGTIISGGILVSRIADASSGDVSFESPLDPFWFITLQFLVPVGVLVAAEGLKTAGRQLSGKKPGEALTMDWAWKELRDAINGNPRRMPS